MSIYLLGPPRLELANRPMVLERNKSLALLAYLALEDGAHAREKLATFFWPDYDRERAYAYLRRALWAINEALGDTWLASDREQVSLRKGVDIQVDVWQFHSYLTQCATHGHPTSQACRDCLHPLEEAVALYRDDFLAGFSLRDSAAFDEWQLFQSEKLRNELASALQRLAQVYSDLGNASRAVLAGRRWLALDVLNEAAHRQLMEVYARAGQRSAALRQYLECKRILQGELDVEPQPETIQLYESIKKGRFLHKADKQLEQTPNLQSPAPATFQLLNFPTLAVPFVGRKKELGEIEQLLHNPECRLVTLLGPGGIGKTRLSIEVGKQLIAQRSPVFPDGLAFVPLAPVNSAEYLVPAIASSLKLQFRSEQLQRDTPETQKVQLLEHLRERRLLLVLDNFEHLVAGVDLLVEILAASPGVKILATSRERLHLAEEWIFDVRGMAIPENGSSEMLAEYSAVQLFLQNARRMRPSLNPSQTDLAAIVRICRLVEGVPLAIELAAAWIKVLSYPEIAAEIERNLDFLASALHGVPERHQSLRAVFEHSWGLLSPLEQDALKGFTVFRSPFRRAAAAAIAGQEQDKSAAFMLRLSALVDKSLLRRVGSDGDEARFAMHELIRQYAAEKLHLDELEAEQTGRRHASHYAAWLPRMEAEMHCSRQIRALNQVDAEIEDVRAAWRWSIEHEDFSLLLQLMDGMFQFYNTRSRLQEAEEDFRLGLLAVQAWRINAPDEPSIVDQLTTLETVLLAYTSSVLFAIASYDQAILYYTQALELAGQLTEPYRARVYTLLSFGELRLPQPEIEGLYRWSQDFFRRVGDTWSVALTMLVHVSYAHFTLVDMAYSRRLIKESLALFRELGDRLGTVLALGSQATLSYTLGEYLEAKQASQESMELSWELGDRWRVATAQLNLGQACVALGEYDQARSVYTESLALVRELGNRRVEARYLACLGYVDYLMGEYSRAREMFLEALELSRQMQDIREMGMSHMNLGNIAQASNELEEASRHYRSAIELLEDLPFARWELSISLKRMAQLLANQGNPPAAWANYRRALEISLQLKRVPELLDNLVGVAELFSISGESERSVEIFLLVLAHSETAQDVRQRAQELLELNRSKLSPAAFEQASSRHPAQSLEAVVQAILDQPVPNE